MHFGSPIALPFGATDNMIATLSATRNGASLLVDATALAGLGAGYWTLYCNSGLVGTQYAADGGEMLWTAPSKPGLTNQRVSVLRLGRWASYDMQRVARALDSQTSQRVTVSWNWNDLGPISAGSINDGGYLTAWTLACTYQDGIPVPLWSTRIYFAVNLTVAAGVGTVTLSNSAGVFATGTGAVNTTLNLLDSTSAVIGTVHLDAAAVTTAGAAVYFRWPKSVDIIRGVTGVSTTTAGTVLYDQSLTGKFTETANLSGSYYYALRPTSDTGEQPSMPTTGGAAAPATVPEPPTALAYKDGNHSNTRIQFTASTTAGCTYSAYWQPIGSAYMDLLTPAVTGSSSPLILPAVTGYPGTVNVILRATKSGVQEQNAVKLSIEYDAAGAVVVARPNVPTLSPVTVSGGTTMSVLVQYPTAGQAVAATTVKLYAHLLGLSYGAAQATATLSATNQYGLKTATLSYSFPAGFYICRVTSCTAGGVESLPSAEQVFSTDTTVPSLSTPVVYVSRG